jgi:hypothetical protein
MALSALLIDCLLTNRTLEFNGNSPIEKISQIDISAYPARNACISLHNLLVYSHGARMQVTYLRPTAARFLSERSARKTAAAMATPESIIDPKTCQSQIIK